MPVLLVAILNDPGRVWDVLDAWQTVGVHDATIFDSTGLHRAMTQRDDLPLFPSLNDVLESTETRHGTIWSVMDDTADLEAIVRATEAQVGPLDAPHAGIMFAVPVIKTWGLRRKSEAGAPDANEP